LSPISILEHGGEGLSVETGVDNVGTPGQTHSNTICAPAGGSWKWKGMGVTIN